MQRVSALAEAFLQTWKKMYYYKIIINAGAHNGQAAKKCESGSTI